MIYMAKFNGFIADAANIDFTRCDGKVYHCDSATASNMTSTANSIAINCGQSAYPRAFIDTDQGLECSFTNAMFDMDMFEIANTGNAADLDSSTLETKKYAVKEGLVITLPFEVEPTSVYVRGLEYLAGDTASEGKFVVKVDGKATTITFYTSDVAVNDEIYVSYKRRIANAHVVTVTTSSKTARGEVFMHWPVYSSGTDCTESAIKGWVHVHVFRSRVTALPAIDSSYKTAATHSMTFTAIDPQRADGRMYEITYEPLAAGGAIDTNYGDTVDYL